MGRHSELPKYLEWLRDQPCVVCQAAPPSEAHHLKGDLHASGAGLKAPDYLAMPLCMMCHIKMHEYRDDWRERQREALLRTLKRALELGILGTKET